MNGHGSLYLFEVGSGECCCPLFWLFWAPGVFRLVTIQCYTNPYLGLLTRDV